MAAPAAHPAVKEEADQPYGVTIEDDLPDPSTALLVPVPTKIERPPSASRSSTDVAQESVVCVKNDVKGDATTPERTRQDPATAAPAGEAKVEAEAELADMCVQLTSKLVEMFAFTAVAGPVRRLSLAAPVGVSDDRADAQDADFDAIGQRRGREGEAGQGIIIDHLPLQDMSLGSPFPHGNTMFHNVQRIRNTVNGYVVRMAYPRWFETLKKDTLKALQVRLEKYSSQIIGVCVYDIQVSYQQVVARMNAILQLHKAIHAWINTQEEGKLTDTLPHFATILNYMLSAGLSLSEDLAIVCCYALFQGFFSKTGSVPYAIKHFDRSVLQDVVSIAEFQQQFLGADEESMESPVKEEPGAASRPNAAQGPPTTTASAPVKKRKKGETKDLGTKICTGAPVLHHLATMVSESVQKVIFRLPKDPAQVDGCVVSLAQEFSSIVDHWGALTDGLERDAGFEFDVVLKALHTIVRCSIPSERDRPDTGSVRLARRVVNRQQHEPNTPTAEMARSMMAYAGSDKLMEASRLHMLQSVEDDTATQALNSAEEQFNQQWASAFDSLDSWCTSVAAVCSDGGLKPVEDQFMTMALLFAGITGALQKWSPAAVRHEAEFVSDLLGNAKVVLQLGPYVMVLGFDTAIGQHLGQLTAMAESKEEEAGVFFEQMKGKLRNAVGGVGLVSAVLKDMFNRWCSCDKALRDRAGTIAGGAEGSEAASGFATFAEDVGSTECRLVSVLSYIQNAIELMSVKDATKDAIIKFASLTRELQADSFDWRVSCDAEYADALQRATTAIRDFMNATGLPLYEASADAFISSKLHLVDASLPFGLGGVHENVMKAAQGASSLKLLVTGVADFGVTAASGITEYVDGDTQDAVAFANIQRNQCLVDLCAFVEAGQVEGILLPDAVSPDSSEGARLPSKYAVHYFGVVNVVKDVGSVASALHLSLFDDKADSNKKLEDGQVLFGQILNMYCILVERLQTLEAMLTSDVALEFEGSGWTVSVNYQQCRHWRTLAGIFATKVQEAALRLMAASLQKKVDHCTRIANDPAAAIDAATKKLNLSLALKMYRNKLQPIIAAYNAVHKHLSGMSLAGSRMKIEPRIQDNELTNESTAQGMACLARVSQTIVFIKGVELLNSYAGHPSGSQEARSFLEKHTTSKNRDLAAAFWDELQALAEDAGQATGGDMADGNREGGALRASASSSMVAPIAKTEAAPPVGGSDGPMDANAATSCEGPEGGAASAKRPCAPAPQAKGLKKARRACV